MKKEFEEIRKSKYFKYIVAFGIIKKVILLLLFISLVFSCSGSDKETTYYRLKLDTTMANPQTLVFSDICFNNECYTITNDLQTFTMDKLSSTSNVETTLNFACLTKPHNQDVIVNFHKDQTTTITLTKHMQSQQGCSLGFSVSYE